MVFNDLKTRRTRDVKFDLETILNPYGETGPVYAVHARAMCQCPGGGTDASWGCGGRLYSCSASQKSAPWCANWQRIPRRWRRPHGSGTPRCSRSISSVSQPILIVIGHGGIRTGTVRILQPEDKRLDGGARDAHGRRAVRVAEWLAVAWRPDPGRHVVTTSSPESEPHVEHTITAKWHFGKDTQAGWS